MDLYPLWQSHTFGPVQLPREEQLLTRSQETTTVTTTKELRILWWINTFGLTAIHVTKHYLDFHTNGWERSASLCISFLTFPQKKKFLLFVLSIKICFPSAILVIGAIVEIMWNHAKKVAVNCEYWDLISIGTRVSALVTYRCNTLNNRHCNWNFLRNRTKP